MSSEPCGPGPGPPSAEAWTRRGSPRSCSLQRFGNASPRARSTSSVKYAAARIPSSFSNAPYACDPTRWPLRERDGGSERAEDRACPRVGPDGALLDQGAHLAGERGRLGDRLAEGARPRLGSRIIDGPHVVGGLSAAGVVELSIIELASLHFPDAHGARAAYGHGGQLNRPTFDLGERGLKSQRMARKKDAIGLFSRIGT